jgi:hypothetical protein
MAKTVWFAGLAARPKQRPQSRKRTLTQSNGLDRGKLFLIDEEGIR